MRIYLFFITLVCLAVFAASCSPMRANYTVFLKDKEESLYNLKGETCQESGYQLDDSNRRLITTYKNCDVHLNRKLEEFEPKLWLPNKERK